VTDQTYRAAGQLTPGDVISDLFLPASAGSPSVVVGVFPYELERQAWVLVVSRVLIGGQISTVYPAADYWLADARIPVEPWRADLSGLSFSRDAEAPAGEPVPAGVDGQPVGRAAQAKAECGCPVRPFPEGRGDPADTIVEHLDACTQDGAS
jgi:hypothetical protein